MFELAVRHLIYVRQGCPNQNLCASGAVKKEEENVNIKNTMSKIKNTILVLSGKGKESTTQANYFGNVLQPFSYNRRRWQVDFLCATCIWASEKGYVFFP